MQEDIDEVFEETIDEELLAAELVDPQAEDDVTAVAVNSDEDLDEDL